MATNIPSRSIPTPSASPTLEMASAAVATPSYDAQQAAIVANDVPRNPLPRDENTLLDTSPIERQPIRHDDQPAKSASPEFVPAYDPRREAQEDADREFARMGRLGNAVPNKLSAVDQLDAHEARCLHYIALATEHNPAVGASIEKIERVMVDVPSHSIIVRLTDLGLIFAPVSATGDSLSRNRVTTTIGHDIAGKYARKDLTPKVPVGGPRDVKLPGDDVKGFRSPDLSPNLPAPTGNTTFTNGAREAGEAKPGRRGSF